jgi:hypothetical protein
MEDTPTGLESGKEEFKATELESENKNHENIAEGNVSNIEDEPATKSTTDATEMETSNSELRNAGQESSIKETGHDIDKVDYEDVLSEKLIDQVKGVIYGNCIGDAVGLLTEFMSKEQARMVRRACSTTIPRYLYNI